MRRQKKLTSKQQVFSTLVWKLLFIMFFVEFVKGALLIIILPVYMDTALGLSAAVIGWALGLQYLGDNLFRSPIGWIIDRLGYRYSILFGVLTIFISLVMIIALEHIYWILMACLIFGIGLAPLWPCVILGATEAAGDKAKGRIISIVYMSWLSGIGTGPIVINFFISKGSYDLAFQVLLIIMSAVAFIALILPNVDVKTDAYNTRVNSLYNQTKRWEKIKAYFQQAAQSLHVSKMFFPAMFAQNFAIGLITPVLTLYIHKVMKLTPLQYNTVLLVGGLITVALMLPVGRFVDKWGTAWFLHVGFLLSAVVFVSFTYAHSMSSLYVWVVLMGIGYALIIPAWNTLIAKAVPKEKKGAFWGFFLTIEGAGMVIGTVISGILWDALGPHAPFVASGFVLLCLFFLHISISHHKQVVIR